MENTLVRKSVPLGQYRELPVPESWLDVFENCKPFLAPLRLPTVFDVRTVVEPILKVLGERVEKIIRLRYGFEDGQMWTLEQIGDAFDLTRERVRQIIDKNQNKHQIIQSFQKLVKELGWFNNQSRLMFTTANSSELSFCLIGLGNACGLQCLQLGNGCLVIFQDAVLQSNFAKVIRQEAYFYNLEEASVITGLSTYELIHAHGIFSGVYLTVGATLGSHRWQMPEIIEALAFELCKIGVQEWHFSQMAQAIRMIFPDRFKDLKNRDIAAVVSRPNSRFQNVGAKGMWRLTSLGDGFTDTKTAIVNMLHQNIRPLHNNEILEQLKRPIQKGTLIALLSREPIFKNYGAGFFGLHTLDYPVMKYNTDEDWLLGLLDQRDTIGFDEVKEKAIRAGLDFLRIRLTVQNSKKLHYNSKKAEFERTEVYYRRRLRYWLPQSSKAELPAVEILNFWIQDCAQRQDAEILLQLKRILEQQENVLQHSELIQKIDEVHKC